MKPLSGKKVLITRGKQQAQEFSRKILELGGVPFEVPLLSFQHPKDLLKIESTLKRIKEYDWIIFTSKNGVEFFFEFLEKYGISTSLLKSKKIAVVGKKTEAVLRNHGFSDIVVPEKYVAESLIEHLKSTIMGNEQFLLARGNLARSTLPEELLRMGCKVTDLIVYDTVKNDSSKNELTILLHEKKMDIITFSSPSTIENFISLLNGTNWRQWIQDSVIACIGPVTEKKALENQIPVHISPKEYTIDGMIQSIVSYVKTDFM